MLIYKKSIFLFFVLVFPSILMAQTNWVYLIDGKNGSRFEVNESSIVKNNDLISFELRSQPIKTTTTLIDIFNLKQDYEVAGYVTSCSEPKFSTYFIRDVDAEGRVIKEKSSTSLQFASLNLKLGQKDSIVNIAALKYCNVNFSKRNPATLSDISNKNPQNQNEWTTVRSSFLFPNSEIRGAFLVDSTSVFRLDDNLIQVPANAFLIQPSDMDGLKGVKSILSLNQLDCKSLRYRAEIIEHFNEGGSIIKRGGWKGYEPEFKPVPTNSNLDLIASSFCPKISQLALIGSGSDPIKTSSLISNASSIKVNTSPVIEPPTSGKRLALVIGNAGYKTRPLANPVNDANDISTALKNTGFEVIDIRDGNLNQMRAALRQFGDKLLTSDVGLVYYSGHGIEVKGQNYLIPVNADIKRSDEITDQSLNMSLILDKMETAQKGVNILIVDACRDDPFGRSFRSSSNGLAQVDAPRGTIVAFATSPGKVAADGDGRNSPYTKNLIKAIQMPNLPIEQVFKLVRRAVQEETRNQQTPWENTSLSGDFYFSVRK